MYLISGYSALNLHRALPSVQAIGLQGLREEQTIVLDGNKEEIYSSRLASATALSSGGVLITGGKGREQEVFLLSGPNLSSWQRRADMRSPRMGHGAVSFQLDGMEVVMVAGGWDQRGRILSTVEIFLIGQNVWQEYVSMPSPRADFMLQVKHPQIKDPIDKSGDQRQGDSHRRLLHQWRVFSTSRSQHLERSTCVERVDRGKS